MLASEVKILGTHSLYSGGCMAGWRAVSDSQHPSPAFLSPDSTAHPTPQPPSFREPPPAPPAHTIPCLCWCSLLPEGCTGPGAWTGQWTLGRSSPLSICFGAGLQTMPSSEPNSELLSSPCQERVTRGHTAGHYPDIPQRPLRVPLSPTASTARGPPSTSRCSELACRVSHAGSRLAGPRGGA